MKKGNIIVSLAGIALGGYAILTASKFPQNNSAVDPGAAFYPTLMAALLIALCALLLILSLLNRGVDIQEKLEITSGMKRAGIGLVMFFIYCMLLKPLGFIFDTIWLCFAGMYLLQNRKYVQMAIISVLVAVVIYFVFAVMLAAKIPAGVLRGIL